MFGLPSLSKLLVLGLIIAAVWYGFKFLGRLDAQRKAEGGVRKRRPAPEAEPEPETVAMVACRQCGAYVADTGKSACEHEGCPMLTTRQR
ncbi:hypothetical protein GH722_07265 [Alphaproteobacteria bacterium HT1-32]|nr:hypothetical protein [Alphaproteobacteria bacterium HT1-32]|tara:strand:+ start:2979 stop:3248 length:270 start_codon:yes stop_codon:yes gene_type:complete